MFDIVVLLRQYERRTISHYNLTISIHDSESPAETEWGFFKRVVPLKYEVARTLSARRTPTMCNTIENYVTAIYYYKGAEKILCKTFGEYLSLFLKLSNWPNEIR